MEEKKSIKISLGTTICLIIIALLIIVLGVVCYLKFINDKQDNNVSNTEQINTYEKVEDDNVEEKNIGNSDYKGIVQPEYIVQPDKQILDIEYITGYEGISFLEDGTFNIDLGWGMNLLGTYTITDNKINCVANEFEGEFSPKQKIEVEIIFEKIDKAKKYLK